MSTRHLRPRRALAAVATGLLAAFALLVPGTAQAATPTAPDAGDQTFTARELDTARDAVAEASPGGVAWAVDESANTVTVLVDETVSRGELNELTRAAGDLAPALTIEHVPGTFENYAIGGDAIYSDLGSRCSLGFNVRSGNTYYFITAGHCTRDPYGPTPPYPLWSFDNVNLHGTTAGSSFPGNDFGIVVYDPQPGGVSSAVNLYNGSSQPITSLADPVNGQQACRSGSTTGLQCGSVTGLGFTVDYGGGDVVTGMIRTNICAEPGDSGGPLFSGSTGLGLTSGGSGNCSVGGTTFYQPIVEAANAYGVGLP
ncbi:S1 family peptidase [Streptomyces sp. 4N509B]|uniref:S1 family peptidase n=1 Tax=Streptomyces sp. 4N509B TaxID=3457413 RepID=UPI003FD2D30F